MPNDMSHAPIVPKVAAPVAPPVAPPVATERLARRTAQYCARADALADAPDLTIARAASALDHLAALQADVAAERQSRTRRLRAELARIDRPFADHDAALTRARATLSEALLRARPDPGERFGRVPHGPRIGGTTAGPRIGGMTAGPCMGGTTAGSDRIDRPSGDRHVRAISACRSLLDLDALRPFLDDEALRLAVERHRRVTGRHDLQGVAYAALPEAAHLPCAIL